MTTDHAPGAVHPVLAAVLAESVAVAEHETSWMNGAMPLRITAYTETEQASRFPLEIISSIRCIVRVDGRYVFCENKTSRHPWPGGRRNPGESFADTATREVHEETGWLLKPETMRQLGWLHLRHLGPEPKGNEGPYPDFLQLVFVAEADRRDGNLPEDTDWTDPDGYELESRLVPLAEAIEHTSTDMHAQVFLELLQEA